MRRFSGYVRREFAIRAEVTKRCLTSNSDEAVFALPAMGRVLRLAEYAHIDPIAGAAGGEVIHRVGQGLSVSVGSQHGKACCEAPLQAGLQRVVIRDAAAVGILDIVVEPCRGQCPRSRDWSANRVVAVGDRIEVLEGLEAFAQVPDVGDVQQKVGDELCCTPKLNCWIKGFFSFMSCAL